MVEWRMRPENSVAPRSEEEQMAAVQPEHALGEVMTPSCRPDRAMPSRDDGDGHVQVLGTAGESQGRWRECGCTPQQQRKILIDRQTRRELANGRRG